ncbi:MAG: hypothetical protein LKF79_05545 [Solobacterium sp.]|jgi:glycerophosphoryl diester phosphodiesterase|nr:hypothetical protein [Solobacterium sp.]MCH4222476.1 hypothetical protein [Solobacterium sp.]MCH4266088.1 hypothetical protein [Solobacterium sp.]
MRIVWIIAAIVLLAYLVVIMPVLRQNMRQSGLLKVLYAHRGLFDNESDAPENSMKAFVKAAELGFGIETDVQLSSDGVAVLFHDFTLARVARDKDNQPVSGKVHDYTFEQLESFHLLNSSEKIPTFQSFLDMVNGRVPLIIELKIENSDKTLKVCETADQMLRKYKGLYCIESFNPRGVQWFKLNHAEVIRGQLSDDFWKEDPSHKSLLMLACGNLYFNFLTKPDFIAYDVKYPDNLSRGLCRNLYRNIAVCWTVKSEEQFKEAKNHFDAYIFDSFVPKDGPRVH